MQLDTDRSELLEELASRHGLMVNCEKGHLLFAQGDLNTALFRLVQGTAIVQLQHQDISVCALELKPGQWIGQSMIADEDSFGFGVKCLSSCLFEELDWDLVGKDSLDELSILFDPLHHRLHTTRLLLQTFVRSYPNVSAQFLQELIQSAHFTYLKENETLFEAGDSAQVMHFLLSGKIDVYVGGKDNLKRVGEIFHGEAFGEMSLFSNQVRTATLVATRSSSLISLDRQQFDRLSVVFPWLSTYVVSSLIDRIKKQNEKVRRTTQPINRLVLVCTKDEARRTVTRLMESLEESPFAGFTEQDISRRFNYRPLLDISHSALIDHLDEREQSSAINLYFSNLESDDWTKICLERADEVWLVADADHSPKQVANWLEKYSAMFSWQKQKKFLVLIQPDVARIRATNEWLAQLQVKQHFHLQAASGQCTERFRRYLTDQSVGLVLGGGGARGFAQIGIFKAMEEAGIKVDWVGGTSMGSIMGGWIAMGWESERIIEAIRRFFVSVNPLGDYTLPMISLSKSQRLDTLLHQGFGDALIEDMAIPYFCVSSDMSTAQERDHEMGLLWRAIRASVSIPGVIAPVIDGGHYLVDGGLFNNLPCDLMRQRNRGPVIAIDVSPDEDYLTQLEQVPSPWQLLVNKVLGREQPKVPSILYTLLRSSMLASTHKQRANREMVDFFIQPKIDNVGMLDFRRAEQIIAVGYREGVAYLQKGMLEQIGPSQTR
ncbi:patatin-like phospholipase family protein [Bowmanella denitrificans]|uniref:patatin-like phospholipase family protein n=1 Tax=Bowmanella denitrificans TaxID=366582 RepID=UPI000C9AC3B2|nr:patatin-like phospholipase family protein [Bowmanella denitrificans]